MIVRTRFAEFSDDERYRYVLGMRWGPEPAIQWISLNPSTATETVDDPTARRIVEYSKAWGYGAVLLTNLYAFRSPSPKVMKRAKDPIGPGNTPEFLTGLRDNFDVGRVMASWGSHGGFTSQADLVRRAFGHNLYHLGLNSDGSPKHPLYLKATTKPKVWNQYR